MPLVIIESLLLSLALVVAYYAFLLLTEKLEEISVTITKISLSVDESFNDIQLDFCSGKLLMPEFSYQLVSLPANLKKRSSFHRLVLDAYLKPILN